MRTPSNPWLLCGRKICVAVNPWCLMHQLISPDVLVHWFSYGVVLSCPMSIDWNDTYLELMHNLLVQSFRVRERGSDLSHGCCSERIEWTPRSKFNATSISNEQLVTYTTPLGFQDRGFILYSLRMPCTGWKASKSCKNVRLGLGRVR